MKCLSWISFIYTDQGCRTIVCSYDIKTKLLENETYKNYKIQDGNEYNSRVKDRDIQSEKGVVILFEVNMKTDVNTSGFIIQSQEDIQKYLT